MPDPETPEPPSRPRAIFQGWRRAFGPLPGAGFERGRGLLRSVMVQAVPGSFEDLGKVLLHSALVGLAAGIVAVLFLGGLELVERFCLQMLAGYVPLRAQGEALLGGVHTGAFRPWVLVLLPALGALGSGLLTQLVPEIRGGGGDAMIRAYHHQGGVVRRRVIWVKALASILTLGTGGAGGREGPTMQIGGALGSAVARALSVSPRERRILLVAGVAAGISAVFKTPLGAALLAVEVLYRDDFETDALVPAVLASVMAYSVVISVSGESILFAHAPRYPFVPSQLPLYALMALLVCVLANGFLIALGKVKNWADRMPVPAWARPALGGLALGLVITPAIWLVGVRIDAQGQGLGILGGGHGAAQLAITGATWLPGGWRGVELLMLLCAGKLIASALTIGSGGSAGDFAPSLALGALLGGAFGRAVQLVAPAAGVDPGAFALVGMATFYGGVAHVPLAALVIVCELAGNYDLLVPLMLSVGVAFVLLRGRYLYHAQVPTRRDSPAHREPDRGDVLTTLHVREVMTTGRPFATLEPGTPATEMLRRMSGSAWQDTFPVLDEHGRLLGIVPSEVARALATPEGQEASVIASDAMQRPVVVRATDDLRTASKLLLESHLRELLVVDEVGRIEGFLDEADVARAYLQATRNPNQSGMHTLR